MDTVDEGAQYRTWVNTSPTRVGVHTSLLHTTVLTQMPSPRPRRLFLFLLSLPVLFLLFLFLGSPTISDLFSTTAQPPQLPGEIFGLLHFVTSPDEAGRVIGTVDPAPDGAGQVALENGVQLGGAVAPDKPVSLAWYALGSIAKTGTFRMRGKSANGEWEERLRVLREEYPLVVFSKVCPSTGGIDAT